MPYPNSGVNPNENGEIWPQLQQHHQQAQQQPAFPGQQQQAPQAYQQQAPQQHPTTPYQWDEVQALRMEVQALREAVGQLQQQVERLQQQPVPATPGGATQGKLERLWAALLEHPDGETKTTLRKAAKLSGKAVDECLTALEQQGRVIRCKIRKRSGRFVKLMDAFRPAL